MAGFSQISRGEKRRIAQEIHDNLVTRAANGAPDAILDPFVSKFAASSDTLSQHFDGKVNAEAQRSALLIAADVDDDEVDRWYRHIYRYTEVESLRRHAPKHASILALSLAAYPDGLEHVDDRIPDQNDQVRKTLNVFRDAEYATTISAMALPLYWLDSLDAATKKSDASFAAYQATYGDASTAVTLGRDADAEWVTLVRAFNHAIALRSVGASADVVEEGKRIIAPLKLAVRQLRKTSRARATKRENEPESGNAPLP